MKRLMLVWVMILCLVPLGGWAEVEPVEWFAGSGEVYNSLGEHYCFVVEDDHAVLTDYRVDSDADQPAIVHVPDTFDGVQLTVIGSNAFNNDGGSYDGTKVECIVIPEGVVELNTHSTMFTQTSAFQMVIRSIKWMTDSSWTPGPMH